MFIHGGMVVLGTSLLLISVVLPFHLLSNWHSMPCGLIVFLINLQKSKYQIFFCHWNVCEFAV